MTAYLGAFPINCGNSLRWEPEQLARRVLSALSIIKKRRSDGSLARYAVLIDRRGAVLLERMDDALPSELIATVTYQSNEDWLAEEIAAELAERNNPKVAKR